MSKASLNEKEASQYIGMNGIRANRTQGLPEQVNLIHQKFQLLYQTQIKVLLAMGC